MKERIEKNEEERGWIRARRLKTAGSVKWMQREDRE